MKHFEGKKQTNKQKNLTLYENAKAFAFSYTCNVRFFIFIFLFYLFIYFFFLLSDQIHLFVVIFEFVSND